MLFLLLEDKMAAQVRVGHGMQLKVIETVDGFEKLEQGWNDLLDRSARRDVFYSFQWYVNWVRSFAAENKLRVVLAEKDGDLVSVLPVYEDKIRYANIQLRVLRSLTNSHSSRFDMLAQDDGGELLARSVAAAFKAGKQHLMILDCVPTDSYVLKWIDAVCGNMKWKYFVSDYRTNYLVKPAPSFSDYYNSLNGKFRKNVNAAQRKALDRGPLSLQHLDGKDDFSDILERGFALEASGWKGEQGTAIISSTSYRQFYEGIARDFQRRGWLEAFLLGNNGDDLAFYFCINGYRALKALKIGVNDELRHLGPGMLITKEVLSYFHDTASADVWDFCGAEARWKRDWANDSEQLWRVVICNNSVVGNSLYFLRELYRKVKCLKKMKSD